MNTAPARQQIGALPLDFGYSSAEGAIWRSVEGKALEYRDLALHGASKGLLGAQLVRATKAGNRTAWIPDDCEFHYLHVMAGELILQQNGGERITLKTGDTVIQPPFSFDPDVYEFTADFEALEFTSSGSFEYIDKFRAKHELREADPLPGSAIVSRDRPEDYIIGDGPRSFFSYRDLGATQASGRRMHIHVVGIVDQPPGGTGWHTHSMDQFFMPFTGWLEIHVEGFGTAKIKRGDAMFIPAGIRHNVTAFTPEYTVVEVCIPTDYDTIGAEEPVAA